MIHGLCLLQGASGSLCTWIGPYIYIYTYIHIYIYTFLHIYIYMCVCVCTCFVVVISLAGRECLILNMVQKGFKTPSWPNFNFELGPKPETRVQGVVFPSWLRLWKGSPRG